MMSCPADTVDPFRCPTKWELWRQLQALLPRGRAWQTHEDLGVVYRAGDGSQVGVLEIGRDQIGEGPEDVTLLTVMQQYWAAFAEVLEVMHARACALLPEFFCATVNEMTAEWSIDYGFPDPCLPYDTLCDKVRAQGGATCAYLSEVAARRGWTVECRDCPPIDCDFVVGDSVACECTPNVIYIRIHTDLSPAFVGLGAEMIAGRLEASCTTPGTPDVTALKCLIERVKPAHVKAIYEVV